MLLLIGSVGSGKSTFTTFLKEVALPRDLKANSVWLRLNLNNAPVTKEEIYKWIRRSLIDQIKETKTNEDLNSLNSLMKIYHEDLQSISGILELYEKDSSDYKKILGDKLLDLQANPEKQLNGLIQYLITKNNKALIVVLDNCDKRDRDEQLLMFEVANWLKEEIDGLVFLPLRDTTFDHHRKEPPLDTVVNDLVYRIIPPSLEKVIYERVKYAHRLSNDENTTKHYYLSNNIRVETPTKKQLFYLKSILKSLFQDHFSKKIILGLAGRDIRTGIGIFLDFCKSGFITDSEILKIEQSKGDYSLPSHVVSKVLLRGNRKYYNDSSTRVRNLFFSEPNDPIPDPFVRLSILRWLQLNKSIKGESNVSGFHKVKKVLTYLTKVGHSEGRILIEIEKMIKSKLILSESQSDTNIDIEDLITITASGIVHIDLLENLDYLSACSEDVWYDELKIAQKISNRLSDKSINQHLSLGASIKSSEDLIAYLETAREKYFQKPSEYLKTNTEFFDQNLDGSKEAIKLFKSKVKYKDVREYENGDQVQVRILELVPSGIIVELENSKQTGFISKQEFPDDADFNSDEFKTGTILDAVVYGYSPKHKKYEINLS